MIYQHLRSNSIARDQSAIEKAVMDDIFKEVDLP